MADALNHMDAGEPEESTGREEVILLRAMKTELEVQTDAILALGLGLAEISNQFGAFVQLWQAANTPLPNPATGAEIIVQGGHPMPGSITVDTTNETVTLEFVDDHGDAASAPVDASGSPAIVTFVSDDDNVLTVTTDASNPLQGDVSPVAIGTANISATIAYADGSPVLEADGVTPFPVPSPVAVTVSAGPAVGDELVLSI